MYQERLFCTRYSGCHNVVEGDGDAGEGDDRGNAGGGDGGGAGGGGGNVCVGGSVNNGGVGESDGNVGAGDSDGGGANWSDGNAGLGGSEGNVGEIVCGCVAEIDAGVVRARRQVASQELRDHRLGVTESEARRGSRDDGESEGGGASEGGGNAGEGDGRCAGEGDDGSPGRGDGRRPAASMTTAAATTPVATATALVAAAGAPGPSIAGFHLVGTCFNVAGLRDADDLVLKKLAPLEDAPFDPSRFPTALELTLAARLLVGVIVDVEDTRASGWRLSVCVARSAA